MNWLADRSDWVLLLGALAVSAVAVVLGRAVLPRFVPADEHHHIRPVAGPLMPALGAMFAVLIALTLSSEVGYLRSAQQIVSDEASAASRLAWAATSPRVDGAGIQSALVAYLEATRAGEWRGDAAANGVDQRTAAALADLERAVRAEAARSEPGTPAGTDLLASLDALSTERRARIAEASRELPALYVVTLVVSGLALIVNAGALAVGSSRRFALLLGGLTVVVALSLALLFAVTAPWRGPLVVSGRPIDDVIRDLHRGFFRR